MTLSDLWFVAIAILWTGYFVLEGFDFGVGILLPVLGRDDRERSGMLATIGPVWDANEVWLITAAGATFASFPQWYAAMFSAFYLPLLVVLVSLIMRGVAIEYRGHGASRRWRRSCEAGIFAGSLLPAIVWGVAFGNLVRGIRLDAAHNYTGSLGDLLSPYALLGGLTTLALFVTHGAVFLALKTTDDLRARARRLAWKAGVAALAAGAAFLGWTQVSRGDAATAVLAAAAVAALVAAVAASLADRDGIAFTGTAAAIVLATATLFAALYPDVLPSSLTAAYSLTVENASSTAKTLRVMTVVTAVFLPFVLLYQGWSYWVFRKRITAAPTRLPAPAGPGQ